MFIKKTLTAGAIAASALIGGTAQADPVYVIATISVIDWDAYMANYGSKVVPVILGFGGEVLVATAVAQVVEGS